MNQKINLNSHELDALKSSEVPSALGKPATPLYVSKAKNSEIWDVDGKRYLDFGGGIAVLNVGHSHPKVLARVKEQLDQFQHTCFAVLPYPNYIRLAKKINSLVPGDFKKKTFFLNSGAEAVENAVKIARFVTKRRAVISFKGAFHGRTQLGMALTGKVAPYKANFCSPNSDVWHIPFPAKQQGVSSEMSLKALSDLFKSSLSATDVAAIIIEPVQGEGGFYPAPVEFVAELRKICDQDGIKLIIDEVQSGFARTGKFFALEHFNIGGKQIEADLFTIAKSVAAGYPLSGVTGRAEIMDQIHVGGVGSTYGGNPVSIAAAEAVIEIIEEEKLVERSKVLGAKLVESLQALKAKQPLIAEVRGLGSMVAIEFRNSDGSAAKDFTSKVQQNAFNQGLILLTCGIDGNVIRALYPLTIGDAEFAEAIKILSQAIVNS